MHKVFTRSLLLVILLLAALPFRAAERRVVVLTPDQGLTLWLPAGADEDDQAGALEQVARYRRTWSLLVGREAALPDLIEVEAGGSLDDALFGTLWRLTNNTVPASRRAALWGALRWAVLEDLTPVRSELERLVASGRLDDSFAQGPAMVIFLMEEVSDRSFLRDALPPGPAAANLKAALAARGMTWERLWNRYAAWLLAHAVEWGVTTIAPGTLPAVWMLDRPLAPGEIAGWRIALADPAAGVSVEPSWITGQGMKLLHVFTDDQGRVLEAGLGDLEPAPLSLPRRGAWLWVFLWNTSLADEGQGAALTLWSTFDAPFSVVDASLQSGTLELLLRQNPGIADFRLWALPSGGSEQEPLASFPSEGEGDHHYRVPVGDPEGRAFRLSCQTFAGGSYSAEVPLGEAEP